MSAKPVGVGESQLYQHPAEEPFVKMNVQRPWGRRGTSEVDNQQRALCYRSKMWKEKENSQFNGSVLLRAWNTRQDFQNLQGAYNPVGKILKIKTVCFTVARPYLRGKTRWKLCELS